EGKDNSLAIAKYVLWETEYNGTQYMRDTIRQNANAYMKALLRGWNNNKYMYIHELKDFACSDRMIGEISCIQRILLPFSFIMTFILCLLEFCIGIIIWCMNKKVPYVNVGFPVLIISIMVLSFGTLTHATPQRICIHMLPAVLLMVFYMIEQGLNRVEKVAIKGESK
ncbi:MAG: hypothetical protein J6C33_04600, partial [Lachnospiraceae bacterium]|nr:hypothetical protein [Lachnospiraceae bacterium]